MTDDLTLKLKHLFMKLKINEEKSRCQRFSPIPRPVDAECPYDSQFRSAIDAYSTERSEENRQAVMQTANQALQEGYSIRPYLAMIKKMCDCDQKNT